MCEIEIVKEIKMKIKQGLIFLLLGLFLSNTVLSHDGNDGWVTAKNFTLWSNTYTSERIRLQVSDGYYNASRRCNNVDSYMVSVTLSKDAQQRIYSTLLSAVLAKRAVRLFIDSNTCEGGRPKILNVTIK